MMLHRGVVNHQILMHGFLVGNAHPTVWFVVEYCCSLKMHINIAKVVVNHQIFSRVGTAHHGLVHSLILVWFENA